LFTSFKISFILLAFLKQNVSIESWLKLIYFINFEISFLYICISFLETKCQHWIRAVIFAAVRCTPPGTWSTTRRPTQFQSTSATRKAFAIRSGFDAVRMFYDVLGRYVTFYDVMWRFMTLCDVCDVVWRLWRCIPWFYYFTIQSWQFKTLFLSCCQQVWYDKKLF